MPLQPVRQRLIVRQPQQFCGLGLISATLFHGTFEVLPGNLGEVVGEAEPFYEGSIKSPGLRALRRWKERFLDIFCGYGVTSGPEGCPTEGVHQLPDIARLGMGKEKIPCAGGKFLVPVLACRDEVVDEEPDISLTFPKRRYLEDRHGQTVEKVGPKTAIRNLMDQ